METLCDMKIVERKVLTGPNVWSIRKTHLIEMLVDLEHFEERPTDTIEGFYERLLALMPSLYRHQCSEDREGGFFLRVKTGTYLGHVMEHIAIELQCLADMDVAFGRTRQSNNRGVYHVVYSYRDAEAGLYAGEAAIKIIEAIINKEPIDLSCDLLKLKKIWQKNKLGPSTEAIVNEAISRQIPWMKLDDATHIQLGYGKFQQRIDATIAATTSAIAVDIVCDKARTKNLLSRSHIPVAEGDLISQEAGLNEAIAALGFPLVIKPHNGNHGKGITTNIMSYEDAFTAFKRAQTVSKQVICEKFITGFDFRILVINYKFICAARRTPAMITGDGIHSISELIRITNSHMHRGDEHENILTIIKVDDVTNDLLRKAGYQLNDIPGDGQQIILKPTANLSTGGTAEDVTDEVDPANIALFERTARVLGLDICGIDVMATELCTPLSSNGGVVLEVNAAPGFRMHLQPSIGTQRNVAKPVIDMLFPNKALSRIPIIAVTGTNGKTTTTRLIAHICRKAGYFTGCTTTDGIYIGDELIEKGDCSGPSSARVVLRDPAVEFAVLECARGGLLRSGLGFDVCNVAVVTNVASDHLGLDGIHDLNQLARVKSVLPETVIADGVAVLNADDDLVFKMKEDITCRAALFSLNPDNIRIKEHCERGGIAAVYKNDSIYILHGSEEYKLEEVENIPITFNGAAEFNIANALAATLSCLAEKIPMNIIQQGLRSFIPGAEHTPGRLNLFEFNNYKVLIDYAHNPHGIQAMAKFLSQIDCHKRVGIIAGVGDRRNEDLIALGEESAKIFDEIIIRLDDDLRGRSATELNELITSGIRNINANTTIHYCKSEKESLEFGLSRLSTHCLLVFLVDHVWKGIELVKEKMQQLQVNSVMHVPMAV